MTRYIVTWIQKKIMYLGIIDYLFQLSHITILFIVFIEYVMLQKCHKINFFEIIHGIFNFNNK